MAVTKRTRFEVLKRDDYTCRYCRSAENALTVDHVTPVALGGTDAPDNLVAACRDCNAGKSSSSPDAPLVAQVEDDAFRWKAAMALAAKRQRSQLRTLAKRVEAFKDEWANWSDAKGNPVPLPVDYESAIEGLVAAGLDVDDLKRCVHVVMTKTWVEDRFRYFMGVCKTVLGQRMEAAQQLIAGGEI